MVYSLQLLLEYVLHGGNILEGDGAFLEIATCESIILSTRLLMLSSVYSGRLREAASTESAIIRIACSLVNGLGPG